MSAKPQNLEEAIQAAGGPVKLLRNSKVGPYIFPIPEEFTNWREEQKAWRDACALMDLSHHMTDLFIEGPDAKRLLSDLAINSFEDFKVDQAKQFVACNHEGYIIGDSILYFLEKDKFDLVGDVTAQNWVQYNLEKGDYEASIDRNDASAVGYPRRKPPAVFRYQIQGPASLEVMEKVTGKPLPHVRFFQVGHLNIGEHDVRALRHGMVGQPGYELTGPWEHADIVLNLIMEAGQEYGIRRVGAKAYSTTGFDSAWWPLPLPAIYDSDEMREYRQWLSAQSVEGIGSLGGSFQSDDIRDYYFTPADLGYDRFVKFDHDFVGSEALARMRDEQRRAKVTLVWNSDDVMRAFGGLFKKGRGAKYIDLPRATYSTFQYDRVLRNGEDIGISGICGYSYNERAMLSLAVVDIEHAEPGIEVNLLWGEPESARPPVEPHELIEIRAKVAPAPIVEYARTSYREN